MRAALLVVTLLVAGCSTMAPGPAEVTPTVQGPPVAPGPQLLLPTDATWAPLDATRLSNLAPLTLRLEIAWSGPAPTNATLALWTDGMESPLPADVSLASRGSLADDPRETLALNLSGGLAALMHSAPDLVVGKPLFFANRSIEVPYLNHSATLILRGAQNGTMFAKNLSLEPRPRVGDAPRLLLNGRNYGTIPHPGGNVRTLEDGSLIVWADGNDIVGTQSGALDHDAPELDALVLTGMDGWVERVSAS